MIQRQLIDTQLAKLPHDDMDVINCLRYLDGSNTKKSSRTGTFSLKFDAQKVSLCFFCTKVKSWLCLKNILYTTFLSINIFFVAEEKCCQNRQTWWWGNMGFITFFPAYWGTWLLIFPCLQSLPIYIKNRLQLLKQNEANFLVYSQVFSPCSWEFLSRTCALLYLLLAWVFF